MQDVRKREKSTLTPKILPWAAGGVESPLAEMHRLGKYGKSRLAGKLSNFEFVMLERPVRSPRCDVEM